MFDFSIVTNWLHTFLMGTCGFAEWGAILTESILVALVIITLLSSHSADKYHYRLG